MTAVAGVSTTGAIGAGALLAKYGLEPMKLKDTNIVTAETPAQIMVSNEVLRVEHAPFMSLLESVRHFAFLLSDDNLQYVSGNKSKLHGAIAHEVDSFVPELKPSSGPNSACTITANAAEEMFNKCKRLSKKRKKTLLLDPIGPHSPHLTPPLTTHPTRTHHTSRHR